MYVATGLKLTRHLVNTIFKIFDVDHDDQLSYKEFIGIMKDRLHRGSRVSASTSDQKSADRQESAPFHEDDMTLMSMNEGYR